MLGVGVVGYGYWGPRLSRVVAESNWCHLAAICEPGAHLSQASEAHPNTRCSTSFAELLASTDVDAIALATPAETHFSLALTALRAGKHVFVEKPLALTTAHVDELCAATAASERTLMVDHVYLFSGPVIAIAELLETQAIAPTHYRSARINTGRVSGAVGVIFDLVVHDIAILDRLRGCPPVVVRAERPCDSEYGPADLVRVFVTYEDGFEADITAGWSAPMRHRLVELVGDESTVVYDDNEPSDKLRSQIGAQRCSLSYDNTEPLSRSVDHFVECVRGTARPLADGAAARRVVTVLEAAARSLAGVPA